MFCGQSDFIQVCVSMIFSMIFQSMNCLAYGTCSKKIGDGVFCDDCVSDGFFGAEILERCDPEAFGEGLHFGEPCKLYHW